MERDRTLWRGIWSLQVPNKIKNLIWRACRNSLLTKVNLQCQTIIDNVVCDRCKLVPKSAIHALWSCTELDVVWEDVQLWSHRQTNNFFDFKELLSWLISNQHHLELFSVMAWSVWIQRNQIRLNKPSSSSHSPPPTFKLFDFRGNYTKPTCGLGENHFAYPWIEKCHSTHLRYVPFVFRNPPLLKLGVNRYFCSNFMSLSSQNKKQHKNTKETRSKSGIGLSLNSHKS